MPILALDEYPSSRRGGQELSLRDLLTTFSLGHGQRVILGYCQQGDLLAQYAAAGVQTLQTGRFSVFEKSKPSHWKLFFRTVSLIRRLRPETVYVNQAADLPAAAMAKSLGGRFRLVCHLRLPPPAAGALCLRNQMGFGCRAADAFIVANPNMRCGWATAGVPEHKIHVIPNAFPILPPDRPYVPFAADRLRFCYLGRIDRGKGIHILIRACMQLAARGIDFRLRIGGIPIPDGEMAYLDELTALVDAAGLQDRITFVGHVAEATKFLAEHDLCIFPSVCNEAFGRVLVESILAGTPVVANDVGSVRQILGEPLAPWIYRDEAELTNILVNFRSTASEYPMEAARGEMARKYDLNAIAPQVLAVLRGKEGLGARG